MKLLVPDHHRTGLQKLCMVLFFICSGPVVCASEPGEAVTSPQQHTFKMHGAVHAMVERCYLFEASGVVGFSFSSKHPLDFNVHHHGDEATEFPVRLSNEASYQGQFLAEADQEYCFMWENKVFNHDKWLVSLEFELDAIKSASR